jgi:hypothetical protein
MQAEEQELDKSQAQKEDNTDENTTMHAQDAGDDTKGTNIADTDVKVPRST